MGTAFAGIVRAPMTSVVMIFETTRDYSIIVPLMISNLVSLFISSRLQPEPIYEVLARQDGIHLPGPESRSVEGQRRVISAMRPPREILDAEITIRAALDQVQPSALHTWPVSDNSGVIGMVTMATLQKAVADGGADRTLKSFVNDREFPHLHADHPLSVALERMGTTHLDVLPVVSRADVHKLEGVVTLQDVLNFYGFGGTIGSS
jgi:CIC family chloride channel protein